MISFALYTGYCIRLAHFCILLLSRDVPGEQRLTEEQELMNYARNLAANDIPETVRRSIIAQRERGAKTGVKGVLADYKAACALAEAEARVEAQRRAEVINRLVSGATAMEDTPDDEAEVVVNETDSI